MFSKSRGWTVWIFLGVALLATTACTSARKREQPTNLVGNLRFRDATTEDRFSRTYRSGSLYQDFRTVLLADAIAMDMDYRRGYVDSVKQTYLLSDADAATSMQEQTREFEECICMLVFLYGGNNRPIPLGEMSSPWKILLQDDDGQMLTPQRIEKLRPENPTYLYLSLYFYGLDRWSQAFKISFPKLNKPLLGQKPGSKPVELIVTGLAGTTRMSWQDTGIFYRIPAAAVQPAAAPSASPGQVKP